MARFCTTTAYRWLFRDSLPSLKTLWSSVIKSPNFSAHGVDPLSRLLQRTLVMSVPKQMSQLLSLEVTIDTVLPFSVSTFAVKGCNLSGMPCVGSSLSVSSSVCAEARLPETCLSKFVCIGFPAAGRWWQSWYDKRHDVVHCTSNCFPILGQLWSFAPFSTHMNIRVLNKSYQTMELLAFLRVIAL